MMKTIGLALLLALLAPVAFAGDVPEWKKPLPGTPAFLGDDGGGEDQATVCNTADSFREWMKGDPNYAEGCAKFARGLPVVIVDITFDPLKDAAPNSTNGLPLVRIRIPSKGMVGYVQLLGGIHPVIPPGTRIHLKRDGSATINLAATQDAEYGSGPDLGEQATVRVIREAPEEDELYVTVVDGPVAGRSGWILNNGKSDDGKVVNLFDQALIEVQPHPPAPPRTEPLPYRLWHGQNDWSVAYMPIPGGTGPECALFQDNSSHTVLWTWDHVMSMVSFMGSAPARARPGTQNDVSTFVLSVDGRVLVTRHVGHDLVIDMKGKLGPALTLVIAPMHLAWDQNNQGHDTGLETGAIFNYLRHGSKLTIKTYGKTYIEDLRGVDSALDLFPACIHYKDFS